MESGEFRRKGNESVSNTSRIVAGAGDIVRVDPLGPYSSTPSISQLVNIQSNANGISIKLQKANMKLPLGSPPEESFLDRSGGGKRRPNVTVRERYDHGSNSSVLISPIVPSSHAVRNVQFTEPRGYSRQLSGENKYSWDSVSTVGSGNSNPSSSAKSVFPYPKVTRKECDPGEMLCQALKTLNLHRKIEGEKIRLNETTKRKEKEDKAAPYEYFKDTFFGVNSEAANHALHLVFSSIDPKETEQRFRDCWPVYEKKLEGVFRRVALEWIKQLVEGHPEFFQDIRTEAIGGLLVNPGGDRFVLFMRQLCRLALFSVADKIKGRIKQQVLLPPTPTSDPEIENRQMNILEFRAYRNGQALLDKYKALIKSDAAFSIRLQTMDENLKLLQKQNCIQSARVMSYVNNEPDLFGNPTEDELKARDVAVSLIKLREILDNDHFNDILYDRLQATLEKRCEEIYKPVSHLQDVMEEFATIWHILDMDKSVPPVLDCRKLFQDQLGNNSGTPSLSFFIKTFIATVDSVISNQYLNSETPTDLLQEFEGACCRIRFLEIMEKEIMKNAHRISPTMKPTEMQLNVLKLRMNDFDWSLLSGIHENGISNLLDVTPLRIYDINRSSGRTPGINNFLDSSSSSSSGEHQQTSIVRRRSANLMKIKVSRNNSIRRSESDPANSASNDVVDGDSMFGKPVNINYSSKIDATATPLSSTQNQSSGNSIRSSSLFRDSSTPLSAVSVSSSSFRMKKSVSFGDTPTSTTGGDSLSVSSVASASIRYNQRRSYRFSSGGSSFNAEQLSMMESPFGLGSRDMSSRLSIASSSGTPVGLDSSIQERLNKLMESVAPNNHILSGRLSLSPIASSELDVADVSNDSTQPEVSPILNQSIELTRKESSFDSERGHDFKSAILTDFEDISLIEDLEGVKGIMETSYVDFFRNSDSDD